MASKKTKVAQNTEKRKNNEGNVMKRGNSYQGRVSLGVDAEGKRIRKSKMFDKEEDAWNWVYSLTGKLTSLNKNSFTNSFSDLMMEWLMVFKQEEVTSRSFANCLSKYKTHIEPYIRNMSINEVDSVIIKKILNEAKKTSMEVAKKTKSLFSQFFDYAVGERLAEFNPVIHIKLKDNVKVNVEKVNKKEPNSYKAIKPEDREKYLMALEEHPFLKTLCYIGLYSGLRIGEILGLRWQDVDFKNKTLNIEHAITVDFKFDKDGNIVDKETILSTPKTKGSVGILPMTDILYETLKNWYQSQMSKGCSTGYDLVNPNTYVLCNDDCSIRTYYGTRAIYRRFLDKHNFNRSDFHFHALRHTFATTLDENKKNISFIQDLLRHTTSRTTEKYISKDKNRVLNNVKELNEIFDKKNQPAKKQADFEM